jgi:hypothetical protein
MRPGSRPAEADIDVFVNKAVREIVRDIDAASTRLALATLLGRLTHLLPLEHVAYCEVHRAVVACRQRLRDRHGAAVIRALRVAQRSQATIAPDPERLSLARLDPPN